MKFNQNKTERTSNNNNQIPSSDNLLDTYINIASKVNLLMSAIKSGTPNLKAMKDNIKLVNEHTKYVKNTISAVLNCTAIIDDIPELLIKKHIADHKLNRVTKFFIGSPEDIKQLLNGKITGNSKALFPKVIFLADSLSKFGNIISKIDLKNLGDTIKTTISKPVSDIFSGLISSFGTIDVKSQLIEILLPKSNEFQKFMIGNYGEKIYLNKDKGFFWKLFHLRHLNDYKKVSAGGLAGAMIGIIGTVRIFAYILVGQKLFQLAKNIKNEINKPTKELFSSLLHMVTNAIISLTAIVIALPILSKVSKIFSITASNFLKNIQESFENIDVERLSAIINNMRRFSKAVLAFAICSRSILRAFHIIMRGGESVGGKKLGFTDVLDAYVSMTILSAVIGVATFAICETMNKIAQSKVNYFKTKRMLKTYYRFLFGGSGDLEKDGGSDDDKESICIKYIFQKLNDDKLFDIERVKESTNKILRIGLITFVLCKTFQFINQYTNLINIKARQFPKLTYRLLFGDINDPENKKSVGLVSIVDHLNEKIKDSDVLWDALLRSTIISAIIVEMAYSMYIIGKISLMKRFAVRAFPELVNLLLFGDEDKNVSGLVDISEALSSIKIKMLLKAILVSTLMGTLITILVIPMTIIGVFSIPVILANFVAMMMLCAVNNMIKVIEAIGNSQLATPAKAVIMTAAATALSNIMKMLITGLIISILKPEGSDGKTTDINDILVVSIAMVAMLGVVYVSSLICNKLENASMGNKVKLMGNTITIIGVMGMLFTMINAGTLSDVLIPLGRQADAVLKGMIVYLSLVGISIGVLMLIGKVHSKINDIATTKLILVSIQSLFTVFTAAAISELLIPLSQQAGPVLLGSLVLVGVVSTLAIVLTVMGFIPTILAIRGVLTMMLCILPLIYIANKLVTLGMITQLIDFDGITNYIDNLKTITDYLKTVRDIDLKVLASMVFVWISMFMLKSIGKQMINVAQIAIEYKLYADKYWGKSSGSGKSKTGSDPVSYILSSTINPILTEMSPDKTAALGTAMKRLWVLKNCVRFVGKIARTLRDLSSLKIATEYDANGNPTKWTNMGKNDFKNAALNAASILKFWVALFDSESEGPISLKTSFGNFTITSIKIDKLDDIKQMKRRIRKLSRIVKFIGNMAQTLTDISSMKMAVDFDEKGKATKWKKMTKNDFQNAALNAGGILRFFVELLNDNAGSRGVEIDTGFGTITIQGIDLSQIENINGKIKRRTKKLSKIVGFVGDMAEVLVKISSLSYPVEFDPETGKPKKWDKMDSRSFQIASDNISLIITTLTRSVVSAATKTAATNRAQLKKVSVAMSAATSVSKVMDAIKMISEGVVPVYDTDAEGLILMDENGNPKIKNYRKISEILYSESFYENIDKIFSTITDTVVKSAVKTRDVNKNQLNKISSVMDATNSLSSILDTIKMLSGGTIPVYKETDGTIAIDDKGSPIIIGYKSLSSILNSDKLQSNIDKIFTTMISAINNVANDKSFQTQINSVKSFISQYSSVTTLMSRSTTNIYDMINKFNSLTLDQKKFDDSIQASINLLNLYKNYPDKAAAVKSFDSHVRSTNALVTSINKVNTDKLVKVTGLFAQIASLSKSLNGNFDKLADAITDKLVPVLSDVNDNLNKKSEVKIPTSISETKPANNTRTKEQIKPQKETPKSVPPKTPVYQDELDDIRQLLKKILEKLPLE